MKGKQTSDSSFYGHVCIIFRKLVLTESHLGPPGCMTTTSLTAAGVWLPFPPESGYHQLALDRVHLKKLCSFLKMLFLYCLSLPHQHCSLFSGDFWHINMGEHYIYVNFMGFQMLLEQHIGDISSSRFRSTTAIFHLLYHQSVRVLIS